MTEPTDDDTSPDHQRPPGVSDAVVEAVGRITEALETCERARGHLYEFHQLTGAADLKLGEGAQMLRDAGCVELADDIERDLVGRNVIFARWTFQIVEDYDETYWSEFRRLEQRVRDELTVGRRHLYEAEMKEDRRTHGHPDHAARPESN